MTKITPYVVALSLIAGAPLMADDAAVPSTTSVVAPTVVDSVTHGTPLVDVRLRYEYGNDDAKESSEAFTVRTRVGYETKAWQGLSALVELEDVSILNSQDDYNMANLDPNTTNKTSIADVDGAELNQAYLAYKTDVTTAKVGRQRIVLDDARFVGNSGWRQNEQTFDAATVQETFMGHLQLFYGYVDRVYRIYGQENGAEPAGSAANSAEFNSDSHLINLRCTKHTSFTPSLYAYLLDLGDEKVGAMNSSDTYGLNVSANHAVTESVKLTGALAYAYQADNSATYQDADYAASYYRVDGGVGYNKVKAGLGYEVLGSDDGAAAFQTPLATLHQYNGWADDFLTTPNTGLRDLFASLGTTCPLTGADLMVVWHDFSADEGSVDYGDEWDFKVSKKFGTATVLGKYAAFQTSGDAGNPKSSDLERASLELDLMF